MASITKRGDRQWQAKIRRRNFNSSATFETKARAEAWARQTESDIDAGRFRIGRVEAERTTLHEALERYLSEVVPGKKGIKQNTGIVRAWQRSGLAKRPLSSIRGADIAVWRDEKLKEVGPQTAIHHLNLLSHLYNTAANEWGLESLQNPVSRVKKPAMPKERERRLLGDEEGRLLAACNASESAWLGPMVRLALATAMRQGELLKLTWNDISTTKPSLELRETKNGKTRTVPLSSIARAVLASMEGGRREGRPLFPVLTGRAVSHAFAKACAKAEITDLHFHDLRHEATSRLFENTSLRDIEIALITGHTSMEMLKRYAHLRAGNLAERLG